MTMKRYINLLLAFCVSALTLQSCFQDMDHPAFDYPESTGEVPTTPLKMYLPFDEEDIRVLIIRIVLLPKCSHQ